MHNILESRIEFRNNQLFRITVLVEMSKGDVRAIYADTKPKGGYMFLKPNQVLNNELLQEVAGYGSERHDKDDMFPGWHSKLSELRGCTLRSDDPVWEQIYRVERCKNTVLIEEIETPIQKFDAL